MIELFSNLPSFGIVLSLVIYCIALWIENKFKWLNPLLLSTIIIVILLLIFNIKFDTYNKSASLLVKFLTPATICLAIPMYDKRHLILKHLKVILPSILLGVFVNLFIIYFIGILLRLNYEQFITLMPKSVTTAVGLTLSEIYGGNPNLTVMAIIVTGIMGNVLAECLARVFKIKNKIALGLAIGLSAHAMGTSKAIEIGETEGAFSGLSMVITGIITVFLATPFSLLVKHLFN